MTIREFYSKFSSNDESSFLFEALKKLSLLEEIASMSMDDMMWVGWPPDPGTPSGPSSARA